LSPENNNLDLILQKLGASNLTVDPCCRKSLIRSIFVVSFIAIIRPDHPFFVDFSIDTTGIFPGGIFICLLSGGLHLLSAYTQ